MRKGVVTKQNKLPLWPSGVELFVWDLTRGESGACMHNKLPLKKRDSILIRLTTPKSQHHPTVNMNKLIKPLWPVRSRSSINRSQSKQKERPKPNLKIKRGRLRLWTTIQASRSNANFFTRLNGRKKTKKASTRLSGCMARTGSRLSSTLEASSIENNSSIYRTGSSQRLIERRTQTWRMWWRPSP